MTSISIDIGIRVRLRLTGSREVVSARGRKNWWKICVRVKVKGRGILYRIDLQYGTSPVERVNAQCVNAQCVDRARAVLQMNRLRVVCFVCAYFATRMLSVHIRSTNSSLARFGQISVRPLSKR